MKSFHVPERGYMVVAALTFVATAACTSNLAGGNPVPNGGTASPVAGAASSSSPSSSTVAVLPTLPNLTPDQFWQRLVNGDPEAVTYNAIADIAHNSDAVVVGTVQSVEKGPNLTDQYGTVGYYATVIVDVERGVAGSQKPSPSESIKIWAFLGAGDPSYDYSDTYTQLASSIPDERVLLFLANTVSWAKRVGAQDTDSMVDPDAFIVLGGQGYLRDVDGKVAGPAISAGWPKTVVGRAFDAVVRSVETSSQP